MPAVLTGKDGVFTAAGGAVNGKLIEVNVEDTGNNVVTTGAGDGYVTREPLTKDWKVTGTFRLYNQAARDVLAASVNTAIAFTYKEISTDTNSYAAGTGLLESVTLKAAYDASIDFTLTIICNGTAITYDTTPLS